MPTEYAGDPDNTPATIAIPDDGDAPNAAGFNAPTMALFDWIKHLDRDKLDRDKLEGGGATTGTQMALVAAAQRWVYPGSNLLDCTAVAGCWSALAGTGGTGLFFAIDGGSNYLVFRSPNGGAWTEESPGLSGLGPAGPLRDIAASTVSKVVVAIGDGFVESQAFVRGLTDEWTEVDPMVAGATFRAIAWDVANETFVAIGDDGGNVVRAINFAGDGEVWDDSGVTTTADPPTMLAINGAGVCVAMSETDTDYLRSTDGGFSWATLGTTGAWTPAALTYDRGADRFVAADDGGNVYTSADGITWTASAVAPGTPSSSRSLAAHRGVIVVAVGTLFTTKVSLGGAWWLDVAGPSVGGPAFVRYGGGRFWQGGVDPIVPENGVVSASHAANWGGE